MILPPTRPEADAGFVIMEQVEYPGMSGTNTICVATVLLETGMIPMVEPVTELTLEAPAGLIRIRADCEGGKVKQVTFRNVPAFATHLDAVIEVPHLGSATVDVAYGGMFYVIAEAAQFGLRLTPDEGRDIVRISEMVKAAAAEQLPVTHPEQPGFSGVTIAELSGPPTHPDAHAKNVVTVSTGTVDWDKPVHLDRRDRPLAVRHRHLRQDGDALRPRQAGPQPGFSPRGNPGHALHRPAAGGDEGGTVHRGRPDDQRPGVDHRLR